MLRRRRLEDFSTELRAHLALEADRLREEGFDEVEARRRAHLNLGNLMLQEERFYEASRWAWLDQLRQAGRQIREIGTGLLRVACQPSLASRFVPRAIRQLGLASPGVRVSLHQVARDAPAFRPVRQSAPAY